MGLDQVSAFSRCFSLHFDSSSERIMVRHEGREKEPAGRSNTPPTLRSQARASSVPPPMANPSTIPRVGMLKASSSPISARSESRKSETCPGDMVALSFRSAPAQNMPSCGVCRRSIRALRPQKGSAAPHPNPPYCLPQHGKYRADRGQAAHELEDDTFAIPSLISYLPASREHL